MVVLGFIAISQSRWEGSAPLFAESLFAVGVLLIGIAALGRIWCALFVSGYKTHHLITAGPYSITRNPLYLFSFIGALGIGLVTETFTIPLVLALFFISYYPLVIRSEEKRLLEVHGDSYREYCERVPRFLPRWASWDEPGEYVVKPQRFRKQLYDALWFIWIIAALEMVECFHTLGYIPTAFHLY